MKLLFKQRLFSWFDSYNIFDENEQIIYTIEGQPAIGHRLYIYDATGNKIAQIREQLFTMRPRFAFYVNEKLIGYLVKELSLFVPQFSITFNDWELKGKIMEWDYKITSQGEVIASINKEIWRLTDTYVIDVVHKEDALLALMVTLAIDAEKCSRSAKNNATI